MILSRRQPQAKPGSKQPEPSCHFGNSSPARIFAVAASRGSVKIQKEALLSAESRGET